MLTYILVAIQTHGSVGLIAENGPIEAIPEVVLTLQLGCEAELRSSGRLGYQTMQGARLRPTSEGYYNIGPVAARSSVFDNPEWLTLGDGGHALARTLAFSRPNDARPYIWRFRYLTRLICPST